MKRRLYKNDENINNVMINEIENTNNEKKINKVEELSNFPFKNFEEFKIAYKNNKFQVGLNRDVAVFWAEYGIYSPKMLQIQIAFLWKLPVIVILLFAIYCFFSKNWIMLVFLPILIITAFIFRCSSTLAFGKLRLLLIITSFIGLFYSILVHNLHIFIVSLSAVIIWYSWYSKHTNSQKYLMRAILNHEDLLCSLWQGLALMLKFPNGNIYWVDYVSENGKYRFTEKSVSSILYSLFRIFDAEKYPKELLRDLIFIMRTDILIHQDLLKLILKTQTNHTINT